MNLNFLKEIQAKIKILHNTGITKNKRKVPIEDM